MSDVHGENRPVDNGMSGEDVQVYFCGCWDRVGHFIYLPNGRRRPREAPDRNGAGPWKFLDTKTLHPAGGTGNALLTHADGWTALGITDRTVDSRPGSHSTFAIEGTYDFDQALAIAREHFPHVIERIEAVAEVRHIGRDAGAANGRTGADQ